MASRLLTACLVALSLTACERATPPSPPRSRLRAPQPPTAALVPAATPEAAPASVQHVAVADAGTPAPEEDGLALEHAHQGRVDHLSRAEALQSEGDVAGALTELRRALHDAPEDEQVLHPLALAARRAGEQRMAALAFGRLGRVRLLDAVPLLQQARALLALGDTSGAFRAAAEALARDPENPEVHQLLGRLHLLEGELSLAILRLERAVELAPEHGYALNNLGFAYLRANENVRALELLTRAAALLPHVAYVQNNLGVALERTGHPEEAREAFALATSLSPRYVKARVNAERLRQLASAAPVRAAPPEEDGAPSAAEPAVEPSADEPALPAVDGEE